MEKGTIYWPNYGELATEPPGISHDDGSRAGAVSLAFMPGPLSLHTATMLMPLAPEFKGFTSFAKPLSYTLGSCSCMSWASLGLQEGNNRGFLGGFQHFRSLTEIMHSPDKMAWAN